MIQVEDIPETHQTERPPPPPRPAMPIETESEEVPDDITIESTDLDFDEMPIDLPPPPTHATAALPPVEDEFVEIWKVEKKPELVKKAAPEYPAEARAAGLEGVVFLKLLVGENGKVLQAEVLKGEEVFRKAALEAAYRFVFTPAIQNDRPVKVWMSLPIRFDLIG